jgi:hypothetical protein
MPYTFAWLFVIFIALKNEHKTEKEQKQSFSQ